MFIGDYNNASTRIIDNEPQDFSNENELPQSVKDGQSLCDRDEQSSSNGRPSPQSVKNERKQIVSEEQDRYHSTLSFPLIKKLKNEIEKDLQDFFRCYLRGLIPYYIKRMEKDVLNTLNDRIQSGIEKELYKAETRIHQITDELENRLKKSMYDLVINNQKIFNEIEYTTVMIDDMTKEIERLRIENSKVMEKIRQIQKKRRYYIPKKEYCQPIENKIQP